MNRLRQYVVVSAGLGMLVTVLILAGGLPAVAQNVKPLLMFITNDAANAVPTTIVNGANNSVPTRDVDNGARQPFQKKLCTPGFDNPNCVNSGSTQTAAFAIIRTTAGAQGAEHGVLPQFIGTTTFGTVKHYNVAQQTRIYADPETSVSVSVSYIPAVAASVTCELTLSGYTVGL